MSRKTKERIINGLMWALPSVVTVFVLGYVVIYAVCENILRNLDIFAESDRLAQICRLSVLWPLVIGSMVQYIGMNRSFVKEQKIKCRCVGFVFAIGGCIIQAFRISNGQYGSWMTTIQYHLNLAGWYYSIFSVVICFLFGDLLAQVKIVSRKKKSFIMIENVMCYVMATTIVLIVVLYLYEHIKFTNLGMLSSVGILIIIIGMLFYVLKRKAGYTPPVNYAILGGTMTAVGVAGIILGYHGFIQVAVIGGLNSLFIWCKDRDSIKNYIILCLLGYISFFMAFYIFSSEEILMIKLILIMILMAASVATYRNNGQGHFILMSSVYFGVLYKENIPENIRVILLFIIIIVLSLCMIKSITDMSGYIKELKQRKQAYLITEENYIFLRNIEYVKNVGIVIMLIDFDINWFVIIL